MTHANNAPSPSATSTLAPYPDGPRLLADIGGTHARFALETSPGNIGPVRAYPCRDYAGLAQAIGQYLTDARLARVNHAAIAIAYPVDGDRVGMTNHDWTFSTEATRRQLELQTLLIVNDFTALARALPSLARSQYASIGCGRPRPDCALGLIGSGTGLGVSGLLPCGQRWIALDSEGGHASFAPQDAREDQVLRHARGLWPHVSFERVASGPGLVLIYQALAQCRRTGADTPAGIVQLALMGDQLAREAVECFCAILGTLAGDLALTLGARGGIYVGGGVLPRLGALLGHSPFRRRFEAKGRMGAYLASVPTYLITAPYPAFPGVSAMLAEHLRAIDRSAS